MSRRAIIHLGLPKCGSSALQLRLRANADRALQHGVFYPRSHGGAPGHMALAGDLVQAGRKENSYSPMLANVLAEFQQSGAHSIILSSESFAKRLKFIKSEVVAPLQVFDIDLVLFVRRADAQAISAYKHQVRKQRYKESFHKFVESSEQGELMRAAMNIDRTLREAKRIFPEATVHFLDLDALGGDSIALFGEVVRLPLAEWQNNPAENLQNRNGRLLALGQAVNQSHCDAKTLFLLACNRSALPAAMIKAVDQALSQLADPAPHAKRLINEDGSRRLLDAFRRHNEAVETEFGIQLAEHTPMVGALPGDPRIALSNEETLAMVDGVSPLLSEAVAKKLRKELTFGRP